MKPINISKRSSVYYDETNDTFVKTFSPNLEARIKYFFKLRKYPGENFSHIGKLLNQINIKTAKIISFTNYSVITKNINGISLYDYYKTNPKIIEKYIDLIIKLFKNNIYSGDLSLDNFIVKDNEIYVIDMEDYRHLYFFNFRKKEFLKRLKKTIPENIFYKVLKRLENLKEKKC